MPISIILPPSPKGPGMIRSPALDTANLIALLKKNTDEKISLYDFRADIINDISPLNSINSDISIFNDFRRCVSHLTTEDKDISAIARQTIQNIDIDNCDVIILSVSVLEQFSLHYLVSSLAIAYQIAKEHPEKRIVLFGNCPKMHAKLVMEQFPFIDAFLSDGNEYSIIDYLQNQESGRPIEGIFYRGHMRAENKAQSVNIQRNSSKCIEIAEHGRDWTMKQIICHNDERSIDLESFPTPDFSLFELEKYRLNGTLVLPYELSRGCINNCFFCYYIHKNKAISSKSVRKSIDDLKRLSAEYGTDHFHFMDAEINFNDNYLSEFCDTLIREYPNIRWSALAIPNINPGLLRKMKHAGCVQLRWGVEYGSERMLKTIGKRTCKKIIHETLMHSNGLGINNYITLLSGLNIETEDDISETIEFIDAIAPFTDSAKECVFGELGHFSAAILENLIHNKEYLPNPQTEKYRNALSRNSIDSDDIIDFMTAKSDRKITIIIAPFSTSKIDCIPHPEIFSSIKMMRDMNKNNPIAESIPKSLPITDIELIDFQSIFNKDDKTKEFIERINLEVLGFNNSRSMIMSNTFISRISNLIKQSEYFLLFVPWWNDNLKISLLIADSIKARYPRTKILLFGPYSRLYHDEILNSTKSVDAIITGEIEMTIKAIHDGKGFIELPNIVYRDIYGIKKKEGGGNVLSDMEELYPDYSPHLATAKKHGLNKPPFLYYEISRGCKNHCFFCSCLSSKELRYKKPMTAATQLKKICNDSGINRIYFIDDALNFDKSHLSEFLDIIISEQLNIRWSAYLIPKEIDKNTIKNLRKAGCEHIRWGIESANPDMQKRISKAIDIHEAADIIRSCHEQGIVNQVSFITGFPYECLADLHMAADFIKHNSDCLSYVNIYKFKPRRGTPIFNNEGAFKINILHSIDDGNKDEVPFFETEGLDWDIKKQQQTSFKEHLKGIVSSCGLVDIDPREAFLKIIDND